MTEEELDLWQLYDLYYHSEAELLNAELRHTVYCTVPRKGRAPKLEKFARPLLKSKPDLKAVNNVQELKARINKQLGII